MQSIPKFFARESQSPLVQQQAQRVTSNSETIARYQQQLRLNRLTQQATESEVSGVTTTGR
jgi:hypothetical protein